VVKKLVFDRREDRTQRPDDGPTPVVKAYTNELSVSIGRLLAESATLAQALDQTFPNRILARMQQKEDAPSEKTLREALANLERRRTRLANAGLLRQSDEGAISPAIQHLDTNTRKILAEYVNDTSNKLDFYTPMLRKLELFTEILNARYQFKTVRTTRDGGLDIKDHRGNTKKSILVVEGADDERFFNSFVDSDHCSIVIAAGWENAVDGLMIVRNDGRKGVLIVIDLDYRGVLGTDVDDLDIIYTADHDIEVTMLNANGRQRTLTTYFASTPQKACDESSNGCTHFPYYLYLISRRCTVSRRTTRVT
jgi:Protein of unknown function (DUF4435)